RMFTDPLPGVGAGHIERGPQVCRNDAALGACFADPCRSRMQIQVRLDGTSNQRLEKRILKCRPPLGRHCCLSLRSSWLPFAPGGGHWHLWCVIVRSDRTATQTSQQQQASTHVLPRHHEPPCAPTRGPWAIPDSTGLAPIGGVSINTSICWPTYTGRFPRLKR